MKKLKSILTILLCAAMVLSFAACGGNNANGEPGENPVGGGNSSSADASGSGSGSDSGSGSSAPAEDTFVYVPEYVQISSEMKGYPDRMIYRDGRFLTSYYVVVGNNMPEGVTPEYEGQYDVYGNRFFWVNLDGSMEELSAYAPIPTPTIPEGAQDGYASTYVNNYTITPDGSIAIIEQTYAWWYEGPDDIPMYSDEWYNQGYYNYQKNEENYFLRFLNADGSERVCIPLNELKQNEEDYFYVSGLAVGKDGSIYLPSDQKLFVIDEAGTLVKTIIADNWFDSVVTLPDGRVAVAMWLEDGQRLVPISDALELDVENAFSLGNGMYGIYNMSPASGGAYDYVYTNGSNLMGIKLADGSSTKILNWINCDVDPNQVNNTFMLEDGRIVTMETEWDENYSTATCSFIFMKKVPASSVEQKIKITLATQSLDYQMRSRIVKFNRSNPTYRIELKDYSEYNTEGDYSAGLTKLTAELMAGNMPDILDLNGLPVGQLESKGVLADLYPLLNADSELNGQIMESVLKALETNGKLYRTASSFELFTVMGGAGVVGDKPGWTLKDYQLALSNMPEGCEPFNQYMTRGNMMNYLLNINWDELVDWETGKCAFDTGLFADILKLAAEFPAEYTWDEDYVWTEQDDETYRISTGRQMLLFTWLYDFRDWQYYDAMFGFDSTCVGFPVSEGVGSAFSFEGSGYSITTGCKNKEAAWEFIRESLTADYQKESTWQFPTNKAAFEEMLKERMTPRYMTDNNGNYVLDENGEKVELFDEWGWSGGTVKIGALTQEQADKVMEAINATTRVYEYDDELFSTILTDCEAFFSGQKSAEEVARLLQSKMTIYVNEKR